MSAAAALRPVTPALPAAPALPQAEAQSPAPSQAHRTTSTVAHPCAVVYAVADSMRAPDGTPAPRAGVVARCVALGVNHHTAHTQYQQWRKARGIAPGTTPGTHHPVAVSRLAPEALRALLAETVAKLTK